MLCRGMSQPFSFDKNSASNPDTRRNQADGRPMSNAFTVPNSRHAFANARPSTVGASNIKTVLPVYNPVRRASTAARPSTSFPQRSSYLQGYSPRAPRGTANALLTPQSRFQAPGAAWNAFPAQSVPFEGPQHPEDESGYDSSAARSVSPHGSDPGDDAQNAEAEAEATLKDRGSWRHSRARSLDDIESHDYTSEGKGAALFQQLRDFLGTWQCTSMLSNGAVVLSDATSNKPTT